MFDLEYAKTVLRAEAASVSAMTHLVEQPAFEHACRMIYECSGSVIVTGVGKAGVVGQKISGTLASTGTPSHFLHPTEAVHGDLGRIQNNDIVLFLSHSGQTDELLRLVEPLKQREIKLLSIVGDGQSRLARHSDIALCMGKLTEACPHGLAPSVSTTCMLALGDTLALTIMKARQFSVEDYARFHPAGALGARLITVGQTMWFKSGEELPLTQMEQTVGDMLTHTAHQKRHGAVMVVDKQGKLAGIITDGDLRRAVTNFGKEVFNKRAGEIMTAGCKRVREDTLAAEAMATLHKYRIDELPVVDAKDRPIGLIDVQDIVAIKIVE
ncbi:MAG: KpsF/GutQ family sugar-phosphate isomerase [Planctomycetes bacterium]|nr:KpsF/GutQ family sugar-phosphate isomerase [Planctomycetota bacterium]